jgi:peptide/nickel transport system substrate-binding protein
LVLRKDGQVKPEFRDKFQLLQGEYLNTEYLGILVDTTNALLQGSALRQRLVRQSIGWAIDRARIRRYFRNGLVVAATGGFIPPGLPGHSTDRETGFDYQPQKSLELLAAAGFPKGAGLPAVVIQTPDNYLDIVQFVCSQLAEVGIRARAEVLQPNILRQQMSASKSAFFRAQWIADYPDAETYLAPFYSKLPAPPNYTRFQNAQFDRWYDEAVSMPDTPRWERYRKMDSLILSEAPVIPLFYDRRNHFVSPAVRGFQSDPMNTIELKRVWFKE